MKTENLKCDQKQANAAFDLMRNLGFTNVRMERFHMTDELVFSVSLRSKLTKGLAAKAGGRSANFEYEVVDEKGRHLGFLDISLNPSRAFPIVTLINA